MSHSDLSLSKLRRLAAEAEADPRTVQRELRQPGSVRSMVGFRIREALRAHGLLPAHTQRAS